MRRDPRPAAWQALRRLPALDLRQAPARRILELATAALVEPPPPTPWARSLANVRRWLEAALLAAVGTGWLAWVGQQVLALR